MKKLLLLSIITFALQATGDYKELIERIKKIKPPKTVELKLAGLSSKIWPNGRKQLTLMARTADERLRDLVKTQKPFTVTVNP